MLINLKEIKELLESESVSKIHHATGISRNAIYGYRNEKRAFGNFSIKTAMKLQEFINSRRKKELQ